jgi:hypothetical protein
VVLHVADVYRGALGHLVTRLHYRQFDVDIQRLAGTPVVTRGLTTHLDERTPSGVGVGSTLTAVRPLGGARCWWEAEAHYCGIGNRDKPLSRFTMFWINEQHRVRLTSISLIVNS